MFRRHSRTPSAVRTVPPSRQGFWREEMTPPFPLRPRWRRNSPLYHAAFMDEVSPELPPLFPILAEEREEVEDDDEAIARLLEEDGEEDDDDAILPALSDGSPASAQVELNLLEMCRRAAAKLSIDWPSQQAGQGMERDLYDGKRLPSRAPAVKQVIPAVPA
ncbi:hypothetical protein M9458_038568, partial [Cirrhinus mrigala]